MDWPAAGSSYLFAFILYAAFYLSITFQLCTKYDLLTLVFPEPENALSFSYGETELITHFTVSWEQFQSSEMEVSSILCWHDIQGSVNFFFRQVEHLLLGSMTIFFTSDSLISLVLAHSICASGVRGNRNLTGLLGFQQLDTLNENNYKKSFPKGWTIGTKWTWKSV